MYLLQGDDEIEKSSVAREFEALVEDSLRPFNLEHIHAADAATGEQVSAMVAAIAESVATLPMMAPRRVVVVHQAEKILTPKRESEEAKAAHRQLEALVREPPAHATLVFIAAPLDRRSRVYRLFTERATVVDCGVLESPADAEHWLRTRIKEAGASIEPAAARLLAALCGTDLKRLRNDVDRLLLYALGQPTITLDDVRQIAGPAALQDHWAMTGAIEAGNAAVALKQLALLLETGAAPEMVLGQLAWVARAKLPPRAVGPAIEALFRTDLDLKRSAGEARVLLERLVVELCGARRGARAG